VPTPRDGSDKVKSREKGNLLRKIKKKKILSFIGKRDSGRDGPKSIVPTPKSYKRKRTKAAKKSLYHTSCKGHTVRKKPPTYSEITGEGKIRNREPKN